ncbi:hypothetical protein HPB47_000037 [Ixodes persulcatus]|uniref:Uncharacterized protein n=1 Tax=Ixodes persulcatus TaxID=34615 RepID=A0AC60PUJ8_IXOPE|nr:hypothetical protein HPB47_000037 [Ixodes persulcatus]
MPSSVYVEEDKRKTRRLGGGARAASPGLPSVLPQERHVPPSLSTSLTAAAPGLARDVPADAASLLPLQFG